MLVSLEDGTRAGPFPTERGIVVDLRRKKAAGRPRYVESFIARGYWQPFRGNPDEPLAIATEALQRLATPARALLAPQQEQLDFLRETIRDKNQQFFYRYRPVNAEYVVGRRVEPFGSVNFPPEMRQLDAIVAEKDRAIWNQAHAIRDGRK